jgi:transposase-like protein
VPARIPDDEREQIIAAFATGKSCNAIAKEFGRARGSISNIAREVGHVFGQSNADNARKVKAVYDSERRAQIIARELEAIDRYQESRFEEAYVYSFGGKDNTFAEATVPQPDFRSQRDITASISTAIKTVIELDRAEQAAGADDMLVEFTMAIQRRRDEREDISADDDAPE